MLRHRILKLRSASGPRPYRVDHFVLGHFDGLPLVEAGDQIDLLVFVLEVAFEEEAPLEVELLKQVLPFLVIEILQAARELRNHVYVGYNFGVLLSAEHRPLKLIVSLDPRLHLFLNLMDVYEILGFDALLLEMRASHAGRIVFA